VVITSIQVANSIAEHGRRRNPRANMLRCQFRNQDDQARKDQADERCHEEVDKVFHDVPPLPAGCRHPEGSVEQASALLSQFLNDEDAEGQQQAKDEHQE
jgi:hypothetical protein